ncbi:hypothetical protein H740_07294 [Campylobacter showae CC57C]|uniref:Uncharacterized protein n=1 Tax=Campylobacter showae CC57C TaxID=1073353 RepID=M3I0Z5_9BACT|nr:hypothetical protein H740_07294 [Campylobacter showae CC57C]
MVVKFSQIFCDLVWRLKSRAVKFERSLAVLAKIPPFSPQKFTPLASLSPPKSWVNLSKFS